MKLGLSNSAVMGASASKTEDSKALVLCRERKHFLRQALDGRCALAEAHVAYIQSLKNTGLALRNLVEAEHLVESSLGSSTSATPEPLTSIEKSTPRKSNSSPSFSHQAEGVGSASPSSSSTFGRFHVAYTRANGGVSKLVEEKPPIALTGKVNSVSKDDLSVPPEKRGWDYFGIFHPVDDQFSLHQGSKSHSDGMPDLEDDRKSTDRSSESIDSEDDFESAIKQSKNEGLPIDLGVMNGPLRNEEKVADEILDLPIQETTSLAEKNHDKKVNFPEKKVEAKDLCTCVKEIELLFIKASESGAEVPRMLEANKFNYSLLSSNRRAFRANGSKFLSILLVCFRNESRATHAPPATEMKYEMKYLTWHRSVSSLSSVSRSPGVMLKNDMEPANDNIFSITCMNSGSHASTLDRLYAWERKLYDEVKANGVLCRKYDAKCKLLRDLDLRGEKPIRVDKTRSSVKDLHSRICIAIHRIDSISKKIEEIRDKELQPQLEELVSGLAHMWKTMLECHGVQHEIIQAATTRGGTANPRPEQIRHSAAALQVALNGLNSSFNKWIAAQRFYVQVINHWLVKCLKRVEPKRKRKTDNVFPPRHATGPPVYMACREWLAELDVLPVKETSESIKKLAEKMGRILPKEERMKKNKASKDGGEQAVVDWGLCLEMVQTGLEDLLGKLKVFAGKSEEMYQRLGDGIVKAQWRYEKQKS